MSTESNKFKVKLEERLDLSKDFPPAGFQKWKAEAEKSLKGADYEKRLITATYEGIDLQPIYTKEDSDSLPHLGGLPGFPPFTRGTTPGGYLSGSWQICQKSLQTNAEDFNRELKDSLQRGQTSIHMVLDRAGRSGFNLENAPVTDVGNDGLAIGNSSDFALALEGVDLKSHPLHVDAGFSAQKVFTMLTDFCEKKGINIANLNGSLSADPLGYLVRNGEIPISPSEAFDLVADLTRQAANSSPGLKTIGVSGIAYHNAGADAVKELAFALASAVEYIEALLDRDLSIEDIAPGIKFTFGIGPFFFMEIAKLRAARMLWSQIIESYGGSEEARGMTIHAVTSSTNQTRLDPYVNMLRTTTEAFSAAAGGVDVLETNAFDELTGKADEFSRRIARNTQVILKEETHQDQLIDPAAGSYYVEKITHELSFKSWALFQKIQGQGGMLKSLEQGFPQQEIERVVEQRNKDLARRKAILVGINAYANIKEQSLEKTEKNSEPVDSGSTSPYTITPLKPYRASELFEDLRDASYTYEEKTGSKPKVFLATMGPVSQHKARADFSRGFLEVAGFEVIYEKGFNTPEDAVSRALENKASVVVICSSDETYPDLVPPITKGIKDAAPGTLVALAGYPKDQLDAHRQSGVDEFIYFGANVRDILGQMLTKLGILQGE